MRISDWSSDVCSSDLKKLTGPGICNREFELFGTFLLAGVLEFDPDALRRCASGRLLAVSLGTGVERFDLAQLLAELVFGSHCRHCTVGFSVRMPSIICRRARVQEESKSVGTGKRVA